MDKKSLKIKNIEPILSQKIQSIYQQNLEHQIEHISCKIFDNVLIVILEGSITNTEKLLRNSDRPTLAYQIRETIDRKINPQIKKTIEDVLGISVIDFLSDTTINCDITGAIAIFELQPKCVSKS